MMKKHLLLLTIIAVMVFCGEGYGAYSLVWSDEFNGSSLNTSDWTVALGNGSGGWGNNELQYYRSQNVSVSGGNLILETREQTYGSCWYGSCEYTSGKIHTRDKQYFLYGKIEARAKVPTGYGMWPAFWMMPQFAVYGGWAASGEIDIMETKNDTDYIGAAIHYGGAWPANTYSSNSYSPGGVDFSDAFHIFTIEWEPDAIRWYVDGNLYYTRTSSQWYTNAAPGNSRAPFDEDFYIILNAAIGGRYPGCEAPSCITASLPQQFLIDWVRVYQESGNIAPTVSITSPANGADLPTGNITINATASDSDGSVATVEFYESANYLGEDTSSPYSFTWTSVTDGCYTLTAKAIDNLGGSSTDIINITVGIGCGQLPYNGSPEAIPGKIEAEDFDTGGEGVAYHDTDGGNNGTQYRTSEDVDIENCSDTGGGYNVGWMDPGEWLEYTVDVAAAGDYLLEARVASDSSGGTFHVEFGGVDETGNINVPVTGGWQNWVTVSAPATLSAGVQVMRFASSSSGYNVNYFNITASMVTVPNVLGMTQASATSAITGAGLSVGTISLSFSNTVTAGDVISQNPIGGTSAPASSSVDLEISLGIRGDLNVDGTVDFYDVGIMGGEWQTSGTLADIEPDGGDGTVNLKDFAALTFNWAESI
ncbi:MAG: family 16 glycosylhydrolase [Planctomycetes bacterium]|nr:family 16 glycosylhydrolase [Planctomycetota bacterium]